MLFGFWQLKTTVFTLLLASSLGHELLRNCQRDYCYERSIETDNLRKLYSDESRRADIARETRNLDNISIVLRENPQDQFDSESNREIRRELKTISENRRGLVRHDPSRRESYQDPIQVQNGRSTADINDFNRRVEEAPEIQRSTLLERRQETNANRFRTPTSLLNDRENRRNRNELQNENQEPHRFNERLSMRQLKVFQRSEESQAEREIIDRQSRRSNDRIIERERNLLERRERNPEDQVNRDFRRSDVLTSDRNTESLQRRHQMKEESNTINEVLTRREQENNRDVARRESENFEGKRFNERLSERDNEIRYENLRRERENDHNMEKFRRRERNLEEQVNRESNRSYKHTTNRNLEPVQSRYQINEESNTINEVLTRRENNRDIARRESENSETKRFNERLSERTNEIHFENLRRETENDRNMEKSRQISLTENNLLDRYDRRQDERERNSHRFNENGRTQESIQRREGSSQERDNRLEEMQRSSSRLDLTESFTEQRESLDENHHSIEELSERRQEAMQRRDINRRERTDNREFERSSNRLSAQRRLTEHENERSNEQLSSVEDRNERQNDLKTFDDNRESRKPSQRIIEREERNVQRRIAIDMEHERNTERNVGDNEKNRRITSRQDNHEHRYDINKHLTEREITQRRIGDTHKRENSSRQPAITLQEQRLEVINRGDEQRSVINVEFNRRQQHRYDNSPERENILNRNRHSQRFTESPIAADEENVNNRDENYERLNRIKSSRRSEQRNIARLANENRTSRRIDERREENGLLNPSSRRPSFSENERESVEQLDISDRKFDTRQEELRELDERVDQREINRASDRSVGEIQRSRERISENVENIQQRENHNLDEHKLQKETRRLVTRRSNERQDRIESTRSNHQMVLRKDEATKLQQHRDENKRQQREERENQRLDSLPYRTVKNRRDFEFIVDEYKETPTDSLKNSNMAYVQGVLLAIIVMKTFNGKMNIKCQVSQKFQEAITMLGF